MCIIKNGTKKYARSGNEYEGDLNEKNKPHGKGVMKYGYKESVYDGAWLNGKRNGFGILKWPNGDSYTGQWKDDKYHGEGTYSTVNGFTCKGLWEKGKMNGNGEEKFADGNSYVGEFKNDRRDGHGTYTLANGALAYEGGFKNGKAHGEGKQHFYLKEDVKVLLSKANVMVKVE